MGEYMRESILAQCKAQNLSVQYCNPIIKLTSKPNPGNFTFHPRFQPLFWLLICVSLIFIIIPAAIALSRKFVFNKCINGQTIMELLLKPCLDRSSKIEHDWIKEAAKKIKEAHDINALLESHGLAAKWMNDSEILSNLGTFKAPFSSQPADGQGRSPKNDQPTQILSRKRQKRDVLVQKDILIDSLLSNTKRKIRLRGSHIREGGIPAQTLPDREINTPEGGWVIPY
jgi:hypothetical protein